MTVDLFLSIFRFCAGKLKLGLIMWMGSLRDTKRVSKLGLKGHLAPISQSISFTDLFIPLMCPVCANQFAN